MSFLSAGEAEGIIEVEIDRPPANALCSELAAELDEIVVGARVNDDARCLLIHSANPRFFMAGGDINRYAERDPVELATMVAGYRACFHRLADLPLPTIAVVDGHAQGGGAELALACDFRIVGPAAQIGVPEIHLAGVPSAGGTYRLPRLIGYSRAMELMLLGSPVHGEEAVACGLANRFSDEPLAEGRRFAAELASKAPVAVRWIKRCAQAALVSDLHVQASIEDEATAAIADTDEFRAAVKAFLARSAERG